MSKSTIYLVFLVIALVLSGISFIPLYQVRKLSDKILKNIKGLMQKLKKYEKTYDPTGPQ